MKRSHKQISHSRQDARTIESLVFVLRNGPLLVRKTVKQYLAFLHQALEHRERKV